MPSNTAHIADLVNQMPDTDQELRTPADPNRAQAPASKFTGPDPEKARQIYEEILSGGRDNLDALLKLVRLPDDPEFANYKAAYVVHGLAIHVGDPERARRRELLQQALAAQLDNETCPKPSQAFFMRQLQLMGDRSTTRSIARHLLDEELHDDAAQALVAIRANSGELLRETLREAKGKARVSVIHALGALADPGAVDALLAVIQEADSEVRLAGARALAAIGDPKGAVPLLQLADAAQGWERIQLTDCCLRLAERLASVGGSRPAARLYSHLRDTRSEPGEAHIKSAAAAALEKLQQQ